MHILIILFICYPLYNLSFAFPLNSDSETYLRPVKEIGNMPPPNVKIRSRMMSALNGGGLIILNKNKKHTSKTAKHKQVNSVLAAGLTEQPITAASQMTTESSLTTVQLPIMADYAIKPLLQTNFIDSKGRVLQNVVSIPIRVSESIKKYGISSLMKDNNGL
ncbi:hypothetical protein WR25_06343 isoform C [Diploscapter pachys]|uniref:Uncharacterized protein n=2 Tax=Diploscapter pachys TaxID=2018661 RepID=A0A2A2L9P6_9BILA|nr:hypothetical protein WR25_06343 isoform C [Diploscapter pachys]